MIRNLFFAMQGFHLCGGEEGAMKTDEVCDRPLDPFALHTRVSWFCMLHGDERYTN